MTDAERLAMVRTMLDHLGAVVDSLPTADADDVWVQLSEEMYVEKILPIERRAVERRKPVRDNLDD